MATGTVSFPARSSSAWTFWIVRPADVLFDRAGVQVIGSHTEGCETEMVNCLFVNQEAVMQFVADAMGVTDVGDSGDLLDGEAAVAGSRLSTCP